MFRWILALILGVVFGAIGVGIFITVLNITGWEFGLVAWASAALGGVGVGLPFRGIKEKNNFADLLIKIN